MTDLAIKQKLYLWRTSLKFKLRRWFGLKVWVVRYKTGIAWDDYDEYKPFLFKRNAEKFAEQYRKYQEPAFRKVPLNSLRVKYF